MESGIPPKCAPLTGPSCRVEGWIIRRGLLEEAVLLAEIGQRCWEWKWLISRQGVAFRTAWKCICRAMTAAKCKQGMRIDERLLFAVPVASRGHHESCEFFPLHQ